MEFSELFGFLSILNESIKLLPKSWKFMAWISIFSLLLPSILFLLFSCTVQSLITDMNDAYTNSDSTQQIIKFYALLLLAEFVFVASYFIISHLSGIATILVSATSYSGKKLSASDLFSCIKTTWRRVLKANVQVTRHSTRYVLLFVVLAVFLVGIYPNFITISLAVVLGITVFVFQLHSAVVWMLSIVVSVLEDSSNSTQGKGALEKASEIAKGNYVNGFMLNLFFNLLVLLIILVSWMVIWDKKWSLNYLKIYGLLFVNSISILRIYIVMAYTVLYFKCKERHGEEIDVLGNLQYTKLPTTTLDNSFRMDLNVKV